MENGEWREKYNCEKELTIHNVLSDKNLLNKLPKRRTRFVCLNGHIQRKMSEYPCWDLDSNDI